MDTVVAEISKQTEVPIPVPPKRSRKFSALIISGFVLIVVASFFGGTYYQAMSQKRIAASVTSAPASDSPTPTSDPEMSWKTYSGATFTFKYPQDWVIDTAVESNILQPISMMGAAIPGESVRVINPNTETMTGNGTQRKQPSEFVSVLPFTYPGKTVKDIVDLFEKQETSSSNPVASQFKRQAIKIGSASGEAFYLGGEGYSGWYTILSDGKDMIGINASIDSLTGTTVANQILKTFKFVDQNNSESSERIDLKSATIGDVIKGLKIVKIQPFKSSFSGIDASNANVVFVGQKEITGNYSFTAFGGVTDVVCMDDLNESSKNSLPQIKGDTQDPWFCFDNYEFAKSLLGPKGSSGSATVIIDNYSINRFPTEITNSATLVSVRNKIQK